MTRSGMIICRICRFRTIGQSTRPRTRWATGWSPTPGSWSRNYWWLGAVQARELERDAREWSVVVEREGAPVTLRPKHLVLATGMVGLSRGPALPRCSPSKASNAIRASMPAAPASPASAALSSARTIPPTTSLPISLGAWGRRDDAAALAHDGGAIRNLARLGRTLYSEAALEGVLRPMSLISRWLRCPLRCSRPQAERWPSKLDDGPFYERLRAAGFMLTFGEDDPHRHNVCGGAAPAITSMSEPPI